jgi:hypothetical protein
MTIALTDREERVIAEVAGGSPEVREGKRSRAIAEIPRWYNPWLHLGLTTAVGIAVWMLGVLRLHAITW